MCLFTPVACMAKGQLICFEMEKSTEEMIIGGRLNALVLLEALNCQPHINGKQYLTPFLSMFLMP